MRNENKVELETIRSALQAQMHYKNPIHAFRVLFDGWRAEGMRQKHHSGAYYTRIWQRGWLSKKEAETLCDYIQKGWRIV